MRTVIASRAWRAWRAWQWIVVIGGLLTNACSFLGPLPDHSRFFTLTAQPRAQDDAVVGRETKAVVYGLGPIVLPPYLERNEIATRVSTTEVAYAQWDRWAEPLDTNVRAVLSQCLAAELGTDDIVPYPWLASANVTYQVAVRFVRFETDATGDVVLMARWIIRDVPHDRRLVGRETTLTRRVAAGDTAATTAALSDMTGELGHEIAGAVRDVEARPAHPPRVKSSPRHPTGR